MERNLIRFVFGFILTSNAVNLSIFTIGGLSTGSPPIIKASLTQASAVLQTHNISSDLANALPQALILTAIVISFGLLAFTLVLMLKSYRAFNTLDSNKIQLAEPEPGEQQKDKKV